MLRNRRFRFEIWDTIQAFASSLSGTLATAAVLKGAGVGDEVKQLNSAEFDGNS